MISFNHLLLEIVGMPEKNIICIVCCKKRSIFSVENAPYWTKARLFRLLALLNVSQSDNEMFFIKRK